MDGNARPQPRDNAHTGAPNGAGDRTDRQCRRLFIDTSALGNKVTSVSFRFGFLPASAEVVVLKSVARELVGLHASTDHKKRESADQAGLALATLHSLTNVKVFFDCEEPLAVDADTDLLLRAQVDDAELLTADGPLAARARAASVKVILVHELRDQLRPIALEITQLFPPMRPVAVGEILSIQIVKTGQQEGQGVAYLEDGRAVYVDNGALRLNKELEVKVKRIVPTRTGQEAIFAAPLHESSLSETGMQER